MDLTLKVVELRGYLADGDHVPVLGVQIQLDAIDDAPPEGFGCRRYGE